VARPVLFDHGWLMEFVEHGIADKRILRLIRKWLFAGVMEDGKWTRSDEGTPQGGTVRRHEATATRSSDPMVSLDTVVQCLRKPLYLQDLRKRISSQPVRTASPPPAQGVP
jgi:retron-type reverse transcriptase